MFFAHGEVQRGVPVLLQGGVGRGLVIEQETSHGRIPVISRQVQRRASLLVGCPRRCTFFEQQGHHRVIPTTRGQEERGSAVLVHGIDRQRIPPQEFARLVAG